jgi:cyanoexosortase A
LVFLAAVSSLIWDKRDKLTLESAFLPSLCGLVLISFVYLLGLFTVNSTILWYSAPLISAFGLALLASGFKGLKQYKGELFALLCLAASIVLPKLIFDISPLTAKFSAFVLWSGGFQFNMIGKTIYTQTGGIEVYSGCSGIEIIIQMIGYAVIFILMFGLSLEQKIISLIVAPLIGFVVNGTRVALMAIIVIHGDQQSFKYWHDGDGSLIFSAIAVVLFGLFCWLLLRSQKQNAGVK